MKLILKNDTKDNSYPLGTTNILAKVTNSTLLSIPMITCGLYLRAAFIQKILFKPGILRPAFKSGLYYRGLENFEIINEVAQLSI